ncbi:MAG: hypothetical protein FJW86_07095 [Actinobacteria bacterium]|jgi:hypothetical protein|nr:hypothetical protein [Actinomycetota bacterium]
MGQEITVNARQGSSPSVRIFDCNRSLTSMAIERYASMADAKGSRPPDVLANRLLGLGATRVTIYSSDVTVEAPAEKWDALEPKVVETIQRLFGFYGDDAGWSDENLRAMGVEPLPRPEPTA